jgi:glycosyltransferase involved in cell wall biosynthesis
VISIVIRTRNEAAWIGSCLEAVALQDAQLWEVILVDHASTDDTLSVARRFGCRIVRIAYPGYSHGRAINRQLPLIDSHPFDKRDLWTTFGIERRVQRVDHFFHNANSMIRRSVWEVVPFDEDISGVEDRDWARRVIASGYCTAYEPLAAYHHHGIHQGRDPARAERVVRVIQMIDGRLSPATKGPSRRGDAGRRVIRMRTSGGSR